MTAYTPIYNLPYVEASDLVASYPTVSEELAENVETALGVVAGSGGLTLIDEESFSAVSSVSLNNVFSPTYQNYKILINLAGSTDSNIVLKMRLSGTDATTNYQWQVLNVSSTSVTAVRVTAQSTYAVSDTSTQKSSHDIDMFSPAQSSATNIHVLSNGRTNPTLYTNVGQHTTATAYDGFTLAVISGTITGTIRVYGYKGA